MDNAANVKSIAALEHFEKCLALTSAELVRASDDIRIELDRVSSHLQKEAPAYWKQQFTRAQQCWAEARQALSLCEQVTRESERRPCTEQKKELLIAKRRVEFCEQRLRAVKALGAAWQQELLKIQSHNNQLMEVGQSGLPAAAVTLMQILNALRKYANLEAGGSPSL